MTASWTLSVARNDLADAAVAEAPVPALADGEVLLRVERVGMTANNVTYGVLGDAFRYWEFFPAGDPGRGLVPVWGFAEVAASTVDGVPEGRRYYGYLPPASHLVVRPDRVEEHRFRDAGPHRAGLPSAYNSYLAIPVDDLQILLRPLFFTSFMLADFLVDNAFQGAEVVVLSSASSKTAYAAAFELRDAGVRLVGLTSPGNVRFTEGLGCYDEVLPYDGVEALDPARPALYVDVSGRPDVRAALRQHPGLVGDVAVGLTSQVPNALSAGSVFFAPTQIRKRTADWGREGLDARFAAAWDRFAPVVADHLDVVVSHGPEGLRDAWLEVLAGRTDPRVGHVIAL
ncbi:DUF2855 family protein [Dactylosporangium sucinum]|uniref:DUF2855 family protein n=1 Tax=Dactylosporangium sucinum TaxID=1424081 RepID=A0A917U3M3_9ACTN|nr:DUF2855 family protein [Dactylosporangium sucinum]GGM54906.1 hypothetical protein GCM10007977_065730 [Dactylosporangium sucinum]